MADEVETTETPDAPAPAAPDAVTPPAPEGDKPEAPKEAPAADAPDAFAVAAPEGMEAFQGDFEKFSTDMDGWLKANPQATAREALAEAAQRQARVAADGQKSVKDQFEARNQKVTGWEAELKADKVFGGEKFDENVSLYLKGVEAHFDDEARQALELTGLGSHPAFVRAFWEAGRKIAEAPFATGAQPPQQAKDLGARMYPNMKTGKD